MILQSKGFDQVIRDELELGFRVSQWLDSENNAPEFHFLGWPCLCRERGIVAEPDAKCPLHGEADGS